MPLPFVIFRSFLTITTSLKSFPFGELGSLILAIINELMSAIKILEGIKVSQTKNASFFKNKFRGYPKDLFFKANHAMVAPQLIPMSATAKYLFISVSIPMVYLNLQNVLK